MSLMIQPMPILSISNNTIVQTFKHAVFYFVDCENKLLKTNANLYVTTKNSELIEYKPSLLVLSNRGFLVEQAPKKPVNRRKI